MTFMGKPDNSSRNTSGTLTTGMLSRSSTTTPHALLQASYREGNWIINLPSPNTVFNDTFMLSELVHAYDHIYVLAFQYYHIGRVVVKLGMTSYVLASLCYNTPSIEKNSSFDQKSGFL